MTTLEQHLAIQDSLADVDGGRIVSHAQLLAWADQLARSATPADSCDTKHAERRVGPGALGKDGRNA